MALSFHNYAESVCNGDVATVDGLLADKSAAGHAADMAPLAATAMAKHVPFYIGEGNSVSCGGKTGVSDVFASALWVVDILFNMAAIGAQVREGGVRGAAGLPPRCRCCTAASCHPRRHCRLLTTPLSQRWNFHGGPLGAYATIAFPPGSQDVAQVRPMYYGLLAFTAATANASVIMRVNTQHNDNPFVKCWAVTDERGVSRVVVIHKDPSATAADITVTIAPPSALRGAAALTRVMPGPKGVLATWDEPITYGGVTWSSTSNGRPSGTPTTETVPAAAAGDYTFVLPRASIAILVLPKQ